MLKYDMPLARFRPLAYAANLLPPGDTRRSRRRPRRTARRRAGSSGRPNRETRADPRERDAAGEEPHCSAAIRPQPEQRLEERRRHEDREHQRRGRGVREVELVGEERQERRDGARGKVHREVPARERGHRPPVELARHATRLLVGPRLAPAVRSVPDDRPGCRARGDSPKRCGARRTGVRLRSRAAWTSTSLPSRS